MDEQENESGPDKWIEEGAEYSPKSEFSKPQVIEEVVKRCALTRAKEMKKGYFNTTIGKEGLPIKTWIEDSRKVYSSAVQSLRVLLIPEIIENDKKGKNKNLAKSIKSDVKKINQLLKTYAYHALEGKLIEGKQKFIKTSRFYMPEIDSVVQVRKVYGDGSEELVEIVGHWNVMVNSYWDHMVRLHDKLLEDLIIIIHDLNYFKRTSSF